MKYIWEDEDLIVGRVFKAASGGEISMIGYSGSNKTLLSISLRDGSALTLGERVEVVEWLNSTQAIPLWFDGRPAHISDFVKE